MIPPLLNLSGRWYAVTNWEPGMSAEEILRLRPLNREETAWLLPQIEDAYFDIFARLFPTDAERLHGARFSDTSQEPT